MVKGDYKGKGQ